MKRTLQGKFNIIGLYLVTSTNSLYVLPWEIARSWENEKVSDAIALCWNGKLHFRQLYYRRGSFCFKFFNRTIYLDDIIFCNEVINFE